MKIQGGKGQVQTTARYKSLACIRMAVQMACMKEAYLGGLPDRNKFNADASTMIFTAAGTGAKMYRVVKDEKISARVVSCSEGNRLEKEQLAAAKREQLAAANATTISKKTHTFDIHT